MYVGSLGSTITNGAWPKSPDNSGYVSLQAYRSTIQFYGDVCTGVRCVYVCTGVRVHRWALCVRVHAHTGVWTIQRPFTRDYNVALSTSRWQSFDICTDRFTFLFSAELLWFHFTLCFICEEIAIVGTIVL